MEIDFRKATFDDHRILGEMNKRLIEDEGHSNRMTVLQLQARMRGWLDGSYVAYLVCSEGEICGYCLYRDDGDFIYIRHLYIERNYRRQGLGAECIDWLRGNVWVQRSLRMEVLCGNEVGIKFWRGIGFKDYALTLEWRKTGLSKDK